MSSLQPEAADDLVFEFRVGMNVVTEFVASHTPADVLRELVQNEYDAGGTTLDVGFGADTLVVRGNGKTIDGGGWQRLSVMLGTGLVAGGNDSVEPKANGIGSKNFGMRSLFLFGDRIEVESGGLRTVLDRSRGSLRQPVRHPASLGQPGVTVRVPYRLAGDGTLPAFGEENELEGLKTIAGELAATVIKLAQPGSQKSLQSVVLRSSRLGQELRWRQYVRRDPAARDLLQRRIRLEQDGNLFPDSSQTITEAEYQQTVRPPDGLRRPDIPGYFKVSGGRIRLGLSFRTRPRRGNRLDLGATGIFYYPIGASRSRTGFPFSISAPFQMTEDRSQIRDTQTSQWNGWLIKQAAHFAVRMLRERLFPQFGAESFLAFDVRSADASTVGSLVEEIDRLLRTEHCWPSQAMRGRKPVYTAASSLYFPASPQLADCAGNLPRQNLLHADLNALPDIQALAAKAGGRRFTVGSLIRLRCAGVDGSGLTTKLSSDTEASFYYPDFPVSLHDLKLQQRFAATFDACKANLKPEHRTDLRKSPTTLTAAGTLGSPDTPLWIIDEALAEVIPKNQILHPGLTDYKVIAGMCKPFRSSDWAIDTAQKIMAGMSSDEERQALSDYLRGKPSLSAKAWAAVRVAPVLRDDRGEWAAPAEMVSRSARGASLLSPALRFPAPADERNASLRRLRFRSAVRGTDVVRLARLVEQGNAGTSAMQSAVRGLPAQLLTQSVISQLAGIRFLETSSGSVLAPADVYVRSERLAAVLGEDAPYAVGWPEKDLKKLGCRTDPRADDIFGYLTKLRESGGWPARPRLVYEALAAALQREKRPADLFRSQDVLWTGSAWEAPEACLVGEENRRIFLSAVSVLPAAWRDFGAALGAQAQPADSHWRRLLASVDGLSGLPVTRRVADALRIAYRQLDHVPQGLPVGTRCLLDDHGRLHSLRAASSGRFLINDDPALAKAALAAGAQVAFADQEDTRVLRFIGLAGARMLSRDATLIGINHGPEVTPGSNAIVANMLSRLKDRNFASALAALASKLGDPHESRTSSRLAARLARIERLDLVDGVQRRYQLAETIVTVEVEYAVERDRIIVNQGTSSLELRRSVANAVAVMADPGPLGEQLLGDPAYFLLRCRSVPELQRELERRKVTWTPEQGQDWEPEEVGEAEDAEEKAEEAAALADAISQVVKSAMSDATSSGSPNSPSDIKTGAERSLQQNAPRPLPDLGQVRPKRAEGTGPPSGRGTSGGGRSQSSWAPRTEQERQRDMAVGLRGEEIVLEIEKERVKQLGLPPDRVVWIANSDPGANHDIRSIDEAGNDLYIEVKSTTGRDGRFTWPVAEFSLAIRERKRYMLYRVYHADSESPSWSLFRDPISLFESGELLLDLDQLTGDIGPLIAQK